MSVKSSILQIIFLLDVSCCYLASLNLVLFALTFGLDSIPCVV